MRKTETDAGEESSSRTNRDLPTTSAHEESASNESTVLQAAREEAQNHRGAQPFFKPSRV